MEKSQAKNNQMIESIKIIIENWQRAAIMQGAAEMSYYLMLSLIPILLVVANIIPLLPINPTEIISVIESSFPQDISTILVPIVLDYMNSGSGGAISLGLFASIWSASKVFQTLRRVLDEVYGSVIKKNFLIARLLSLAILVGILFLLASVVFVFVFGEQILDIVTDFFGFSIPFLHGFILSKWIILPLILFFVTFIIYQFVPNHHLKYKYSIPGTIFSTIGLVLLSQFFSLYSKYLGGDAIANQTIGGFIVLLLFLYFSNVVVLFGALINTLTFELKNNQSVLAYEKERRKEERAKSTKWSGYPDKNEVTVLKNKLYKVN